MVFAFTTAWKMRNWCRVIDSPAFCGALSFDQTNSASKSVETPSISGTSHPVAMGYDRC